MYIHLIMQSHVSMPNPLGDRVPRDAPDPIYKYYSLEASLATAVIAGVGIILAITCILFALYFRKHKFVDKRWCI